MDLVSKSAGAWATLGRFGLATDYEVTEVHLETRVLKVAGDATLDLPIGSKLVVVDGPGALEIYTVSYIEYVDPSSFIEVQEEEFGFIGVESMICRTAVPTAEDNVAVTHNIPGSTSTVIACNDLDLSGATVNFACSSASTIAGTVTVGETYTFTYGTKHVGLRASSSTASFLISGEGALYDVNDAMLGESAALDEVGCSSAFSGVGSIEYSGVVSIAGIFAQNLVYGGIGLKGAELHIGSTDSPLEDGGAWIQFPIIRVGIDPKDIRKGVAGGTYRPGTVSALARM